MKTRIIYEDNSVLVVYKPAGLATETARIGQMDTVSELKNYLAQKETESGAFLGVVHRLDQPVEGLLVFAKEKEAAAALSSQLKKGVLNKQYYAVLCGKPEENEGELVDYLVKEPGLAKVVTDSQTKHPEAKRALLQYRILSAKRISISEQAGEAGKAAGLTDFEMEKDLALADIHIDTGRFHQIRAQMAHAGYPLMGDVKYGTEDSVILGKKLGVNQIALCAYSLAFVHPKTGKELSFTVDPEGEIFQLFGKIFA